MLMNIPSPATPNYAPPYFSATTPRRRPQVWDRDYPRQEDAQGHSQRPQAWDRGYNYHREENKQGYGLRPQTWDRGYTYHREQNNQGHGLNAQQVSDNQQQILEGIRRNTLFSYTRPPSSHQPSTSPLQSPSSQSIGPTEPPSSPLSSHPTYSAASHPPYVTGISTMNQPQNLLQPPVPQLSFRMISPTFNTWNDQQFYDQQKLQAQFANTIPRQNVLHSHLQPPLLLHFQLQQDLQQQISPNRFVELESTPTTHTSPDTDSASSQATTTTTMSTGDRPISAVIESAVNTGVAVA